MEMYQDYIDRLRNEHPELELLRQVVRGTSLTNSAAVSSRHFVKDLKVLGFGPNGWSTSPSHDGKTLNPIQSATKHVILLNYLDSEVILSLGKEFRVPPAFFNNHLAGCEQHHSGSWWPSSLSFPAALPSDRSISTGFTIDYRRTYLQHVPDGSFPFLYEEYKRARVERCSILRSYHHTSKSTKIFAHERLSFVLLEGDHVPSAWGSVVLCLCDPLVPIHQAPIIQPEQTVIAAPDFKTVELVTVSTTQEVNQQGSLLEMAISAIRKPGADYARSDWYADILRPFLKIIGKNWSETLLHLDHQVSSVEDCVEGDDWNGLEKPTDLLSRIHRLTRRLNQYNHQLIAANDVLEAGRVELPGLQDCGRDFAEFHRGCSSLETRASFTVHTLQAAISIEEGRKASQLTILALLFAPMSLLGTILSIDGESSLGGLKYWLFFGIGVPATLIALLLTQRAPKRWGQGVKRKMMH